MKTLSTDKLEMQHRMYLRRSARHWYKRMGYPKPSTPKETALMERRYKHYLASI